MAQERSLSDLLPWTHEDRAIKKDRIMDDTEEYPTVIDSRTGHTLVKGFPRFQQNLPLPPPLDFLRSSPFVLPTKNNRISNFDLQVIARDALETGVIMHPQLPSLITQFLQYKLQRGFAVEKALYKDMSPTDFVARLIKNRPLVFVGWNDNTILLDSTMGDMREIWLRVGTKDELQNSDIFLNDYLSYMR
jgi:hypothetical protein